MMQRWTASDATASDLGGFVAYGDYIAERAKLLALWRAADLWSDPSWYVDYPALASALDALGPPPEPTER